MKNQISKSVNFRAFLGLLSILMISAIVFSQENKETVLTSNAKNNEEAKEEKKESLKLEDCIPQDYDCKIAYYTERIAEKKDKKYDCESCGLRNSRGIIYYQKVDYTNALGDFNYIIQQQQRNYIVSAFLFRAIIYEKQGNYDSALSDYKYVYYKLFDSIESNLGLGNIYRYKREYEKALKYYDQAIFLSPRLSKALFGRAVIYLELGKVLNQSDKEEDKEKAIKYFKDALKDLDSVIEIDLLATEPETYLRRSQVYRQLGETEKADADFQKYNELNEAPKIK